ncbi:MAG: efflux RND transporter permease subunit, partial [Candidatus Zixiibacteriota bacterium]
TVALLGIPGVKTIRSYSYFGFSSIYIIFKEDVEFYWSRSRVLEKLNSLPPGTLPMGVQPMLGPDATALGQIFWYTLEGRDENGNPTGGWDLEELRSIQDWTVRYALQSADGVAEVASVGGFVQEYQINVNPDALRAHGVKLTDVFKSVRMSNLDVGARTIEINKVEYVIRGLGFIRKLSDIENIVVKQTGHVPLRIRDVATVTLGPALRRGALDKGGAEVVGGVVVVRYGENPLATIKNVKRKIAEISAGLPKKKLADGRTSQVTIVPFYDRTGLIHETLGTLNTALIDEILVTMIVVIVIVMHLRSSLLISGLLPLAVLITFIAMKMFKVDANIVSLSGIVIAIGTMVDMGI